MQIVQAEAKIELRFLRITMVEGCSEVVSQGRLLQHLYHN